MKERWALRREDSGKRRYKDKVTRVVRSRLDGGLGERRRCAALRVEKGFWRGFEGTGGFGLSRGMLVDVWSMYI